MSSLRLHSGRIASVCFFSLAMAVTACSESESGPNGDGPDEVVEGGEFVASEKQRVLSPDVDPQDLIELVDGNSRFAFDLYQQLLEDAEGNLFYSPHSISLALAMTYAGAEGETETQMADTLHFALEEAKLHPAFNALDLELTSRGEDAQGQDGEGFRLNIVNAIWGQTGYPFLTSFLDVLAENYGAGLRLLDFLTDPQGSRETINDWVADQTESKIEDLLKPGIITSDTRLVLTNAIYFNAAWSFPFEEALTTRQPFYRLDDSQVTVDMMHGIQSIGHTQGDGYKAVELLYDGEELSMVLVVPDEGEFETFEAGLTAERIAAIIGDMDFGTASLAMPKFEYESEFSLKDVLMAMGMTAAFSASADLSGMDGTRNLVISDVVHKAFVAVDEAGTEAAAATAVVVNETSVPVEEFSLTIDRPFIFLIRDIATGAILFVGRVVDPTA